MKTISFPRIDLKNKLSPTEQSILLLIANGQSSVQIARSKSISVRTVEKQRSHIISKLNIDSANNCLTKWALLNRSLIEECCD